MIAHLTPTPWQQFLSALKRSILIFIGTIAGVALGYPLGMILGLFIPISGMGGLFVGAVIGVIGCANLLPAWLFWRKTRGLSNRGRMRKIFAVFMGIELCILGFLWAPVISESIRPYVRTIGFSLTSTISALAIWVPALGAGVATFLSGKQSN
jgi:hypothetical protein